VSFCACCSMMLRRNYLEVVAFSNDVLALSSRNTNSSCTSSCHGSV
jgi:hypothetical protein